ncbi:hypothetical protein [Streptomyces sp. JH34]|uniref:hypothetical protein n=1 Tax=Streptomyces sp. JH34 TaxID=2793633 RepID=UPI003211D372
MTVPRLLRPFVRSRARLSVTLGLLVAALTASLLPWFTGWPGDENASSQAQGGSTKASPAGDRPRTHEQAAAAARHTGEKVLVEAATTPTTLTWALPDGKTRQQINATPQRARNADGEWAKIDTELRRTKDGILPVNVVVPVRFSAGDRQERADRDAPPEHADGGGQRAGRGRAGGPHRGLHLARHTARAGARRRAGAVRGGLPGRGPPAGRP